MTLRIRMRTFAVTLTPASLVCTRATAKESPGADATPRIARCFDFDWRLGKLLWCTLIGAAFFCHSIRAEAAPAARSLNLNPVWKFVLGENRREEAIDPTFDDSSWKTVALPHTLKEVSLHLDNVKNDNTQKTFHRYVGWYRKHLKIKRVDPEKKYFLHFEGVMETTELWVNSKPVGKYEVSGFDSFHFDITEALKDGDNLITVKVDNRLTENTPPDSRPMDFILFGGLYRDVNLITTSRVYVNFPWEARDAGIPPRPVRQFPETPCAFGSVLPKREGKRSQQR